MRTRRRVIAAAIESTEGTPEAITAADGGLLAIDLKVDPDITMVPRNVVMQTLSKLPDLVGAQMARASFRAELKGAGGAYSATVLPAIGKYLRACGFAETVDTTGGSETVTYQPASTGLPSLTLFAYEDGVIKKMAGCRGNVKFSGKLGEPMYADFEFYGLWVGLVDGAMVAPTFESTVPPVLLSAAFSVGGYSPALTSFDLDMGQTVNMRESMNTESGYVSAEITDRNPRGTFDPEMTLVATHDWYGLWKAGTTGAMNLGPLGATQYNQVTFTAPTLAYNKLADAERNGTATLATDYQLGMNTGDDELVITFS